MNGLQRLGREKINVGENDGEMSVRGGETQERHKVDQCEGPTPPWHKHCPQNMNAHPCCERKNHRQ